MRRPFHEPRGGEGVRQEDRHVGALRAQSPRIGGKRAALPPASAPVQRDDLIHVRDQAKQVGHRTTRGDDQARGRKRAAHVCDRWKRHHGVAEPVGREDEHARDFGGAAARTPPYVRH